jgi:excisionase family DNA binding protein
VDVLYIKNRQIGWLINYTGATLKFFTVEEIAESLGVNVSSVQRWVDSGKLQCSYEGDAKKFSVEHLSEFALRFNISMKFLDSANNQFNQTKRSAAISVSK